MAKSHRLPFHLSDNTVNKPLSLIHGVIWGPLSYSTSRIKYYVLFIDDFSKFTWIYPLLYKSEVFYKFQEFKVFVENQFDTRLKNFRTDGGGEYTSTQFELFLKNHGILNQLFSPHTPPQNRVAERKHRHLISTTIAFLHQSGFSLSHWFDALATSIFLINRLPSSKLHNKTPFEILGVFGKKKNSLV